MATERDLTSETRTVHILYLLHALAPFTVWLLAIIAIFVGMARRDDVRGTYLESHVAWLSRTFWWGLLWIGVSAILTVILFVTIVGILIWWLPWTILFIWYLYRVVIGWLRLNDRRPI